MDRCGVHLPHTTGLNPPQKHFLHVPRLQILGGSQQLSCLHTSPSLESKNWERRNLKVYPPQLPDEPRRPAVSLPASV